MTDFDRAFAAAPRDQQALYDLGVALSELGDLAQADEALRAALEQDPYSKIADLIRDARRQLAEREFRASESGSFRFGAVLYCLAALRRFSKLPADKVKQIVAEIGLLGRTGFDLHDATPKYKLKALSGDFTGLQLVAMMFVGFKQIEPGMNIGFDLQNEFELAQRIFRAEQE